MTLRVLSTAARPSRRSCRPAALLAEHHGVGAIVSAVATAAEEPGRSTAASAASLRWANPRIMIADVVSPAGETTLPRTRTTCYRRAVAITSRRPRLAPLALLSLVALPDRASASPIEVFGSARHSGRGGGGHRRRLRVRLLPTPPGWRSAPASSSRSAASARSRTYASRTAGRPRAALGCLATPAGRWWPARPSRRFGLAWSFAPDAGPGHRAVPRRTVLSLLRQPHPAGRSAHPGVRLSDRFAVGVVVNYLATRPRHRRGGRDPGLRPGSTSRCRRWRG